MNEVILGISMVVTGIFGLMYLWKEIFDRPMSEFEVWEMQDKVKYPQLYENEEQIMPCGLMVVTPVSGTGSEGSNPSGATN